MLLSQWTLFIGLLFFFPQESICLSSSCTSLEMPVKDDILMMTSHNFQHILSWNLSSNAIIPTHYTVSYIIMSANIDWKAVEKCTNITKSSCNMTDIYEIHETYLTSVTGFNSKEKLFECVFEFLPITDTIIDPPEVSVFYLKDAINVTVHFPESLSEIKNKEKELFSLVIIKVKSHDMSEEELRIEMDDRENVTIVIDPPIPNSNYCISAQWETFSNNVPQSPLKCFMLSPNQESDSEEIIAIPLIFAACFIIFPIIIFVIFLKKTEYICKKKKHFPKALDFPPDIPGPLQLPYEKVTRADIIEKTKKKKIFNKSDDKSDSDSESTQKVESNYTMNGFSPRSLSQNSKFTWKEYNFTDSDPDEAESPEFDPPLADTDSATSYQVKSGPDESRICRIWSNLSEDSNFSSKSEDCFNFNVNLSTVFVGDPENDTISEEDAAQILLPVQEEKINLVNSDETELKHIPHATCVKTPLFHVPSKDFWSENASSDESVTSESEVDLGNDYIRR
ncbi:interferon alpha/beta receptor 2 isoform X2 [Antechinus flavipes]|uniref:interferon alpha/beta receptor 2 isoform X2 n=1 Tax=Antechinus flavipes TaxID=38775 RepID=UPI002235FC2B|nr:interferon alpha/beta receptor 2 isoform X2 [Antechinus flavipes]